MIFRFLGIVVFFYDNLFLFLFVLFIMADQLQKKRKISTEQLDSSLSPRRDSMVKIRIWTEELHYFSNNSKKKKQSNSSYPNFHFMFVFYLCCVQKKRKLVVLSATHWEIGVCVCASETFHAKEFALWKKIAMFTSKKTWTWKMETVSVCVWLEHVIWQIAKSLKVGSFDTVPTIWFGVFQL